MLPSPALGFTVLLLEAAFTRGGFSGEKHVYVSWVVSTSRALDPGVAAFVGFAAQAKLVGFESAGASTLHTPSLLVLIQVKRRVCKGWELDRFADLHLLGHQVGAHSTAQPLYTNPLTSKCTRYLRAPSSFKAGCSSFNSYSQEQASKSTCR